MFRFFSRSAFGGDPSSEMEAFLDQRKEQVSELPVAPEYEIGRIVGKKGSNFIVQVGDTRREVPPTDIKRVIG